MTIQVSEHDTSLKRYGLVNKETLETRFIHLAPASYLRKIRHSFFYEKNIEIRQHSEDSVIVRTQNDIFLVTLAQLDRELGLPDYSGNDLIQPVYPHFTHCYFPIHQLFNFHLNNMLIYVEKMNQIVTVFRKTQEAVRFIIQIHTQFDLNMKPGTRLGDVEYAKQLKTGDYVVIMRSVSVEDLKDNGYVIMKISEETQTIVKWRQKTAENQALHETGIIL